MENPMHQDESVSQEEGEEEGLPFLPDDALVGVFKCLSVPELLAARVVCRRWAEVALHPDLWKRRDVSSTNEGLLKAALCLAPCVRTLEIDWRADARCNDVVDVTRDPPVSVSTTRCAAEHLVVKVHDRDALCAASIIKNQESLGRLRKLSLSVSGDVGSPGNESRDLRDLICIACATEGLAELSLSLHRENFDPEWVPCSERPRSSLKRLVCALPSMSSSSCRLLQHLLLCHKETLEAMEMIAFGGKAVYDCLGEEPPLSYDDWASAVDGGFPWPSRLRQLTCSPDQAARVLTECERLETLTLVFDYSLGSFFEEKVAEARFTFLSKATALRSLTILPTSQPDRTCQTSSTSWIFSGELTLAVNMVADLASSEQSQLQALAVNMVWSSRSMDCALLNKLTAALGLLPALREVRVDVYDSIAILRLLECASHAAGPGAGPLTLRVDVQSLKIVAGAPCLHAWVHRQAARIQGLFDARPGLHLELDLGRQGLAAFHCSHCSFCVQGCHGGGGPRVAFHGHADGDQCDAALHADPSVRCYRMPVVA